MAPVPKKPHDRRRHYLREWRKAAGLTQEDAADTAGISRSLLSKIEAGKVPYNQDLLEQLAEIYRCEPDDLITVNAKLPDPARAFYNQLRHAPAAEQRRLLRVARVITEEDDGGAAPK